MATYLVRHGETGWSRAHRHTGRTDVALTATGELQARRLGALLAGHNFSRVLTSPRLRARRTAELAGFGQLARPDPLLAEFDYGDYEGLTRPEILALRPRWRLWRDGCPGGESPADVERRARLLLESLEGGGGRDFLLFGHGHLLRAVAAVYTESSLELCARLVLQVASVSVLGEEHQVKAIQSWNLTVAEPT
ncbi:MAG: histidine phosphatase family protein [Candidatus Dormibacteria bacterium]